MSRGLITFDPLDSKRIGELLERNTQPVDALPTPFPTWNRACIEFGGGKGLGPGYYVVLGAATGRLKTTLALNVVANAIKRGTSVGLLNYEMSQRQSASRFLSVLTGEPTKAIQPIGGSYDHDRALSIASKVDRLSKGDAAVWANRQPVSTLDHLETATEHLVREKNVGLIVVDYLQLIEVDGYAGYEAAKLTSNVVRKCVHEHDIRGLALAQITTESGKKDKPPNRYDLFMGGKWAHDANQIVLVDHSEWWERDDHKIESRVIIDKNRHGPEGRFPILFDPSNMNIKELERGHRVETADRESRAEHHDDNWNGDVPF